MSKIPHELRQNIAKNIRACRIRKFPGRGGARLCAEAFGVLPQQWSPWETGKRVPDESRLMRLADFFGVTVEFLRRDNSSFPQGHAEFREPGVAAVGADARRHEAERTRPDQPGSRESYYRLAEWFLSSILTQGLTINLVASSERVAEVPPRIPVEIPE